MNITQMRRGMGASGGGFPYDAEIEYLQSSGAQWIDSGVYGDLNTEVTIYAERIYNDNYPLFGDNTDSTKAITIPSNVNISGLNSRFSNKVINSPTSPTYKSVYRINRYILLIDSNAYFFSAAEPFSTLGTLYLFGINGYNTRFFTGKIYSCVIHNGETFLRNYIPVRIGQVGYMYDRVSGQLFGNAGTGAFILGPDVT